MWDYLIVTASNDSQASAYQSQLQLRRELGLLPEVRETLVVPDLDGKRIGSGGSTLYCLTQILTKVGLTKVGQAPPANPPLDAAAILRRLRILIVHAGGDSRRLPAYGPCGKIFVPIPGPTGAALPPALFDRLVPSFLALPEGRAGQGQIVVAAGDALLLFDPTAADFSRPGITALGCYALPEEAARHGVFCLEQRTLPHGRGSDRRRARKQAEPCTKFLQKPSIAEQSAQGAITNGRTALDIGVMSMDANAAAALLGAFGASDGGWQAEAPAPLIDLYREICCALGSDATLEHYIRAAQSSGSPWPLDALAKVHSALRDIPFHVSLLPDCRFLHFGSTRQLIESGLALADRQSGILVLNSTVKSTIAGTRSWIEACRIAAPVHLAGSNVIAGADIEEPLALPPEACLDILCARDGRWFIRCYGVRDGFKESIEEGALFCGRPLIEWIAAAGAAPEDIWPETENPLERSLWNARVFPAERSPSGYRNWLWMYAPEAATAAQKQAYLAARRYSAAEIAWLADQSAFHERRLAIWKDRAGPSGPSGLRLLV
jgi:fucokinase